MGVDPKGTDNLSTKNQRDRPEWHSLKDFPRASNRWNKERRGSFSRGAPASRVLVLASRQNELCLSSEVRGKWARVHWCVIHLEERTLPRESIHPFSQRQSSCGRDAHTSMPDACATREYAVTANTELPDLSCGESGSYYLSAIRDRQIGVPNTRRSRQPTRSSR